MAALTEKRVELLERALGPLSKRNRQYAVMMLDLSIEYDMYSISFVDSAEGPSPRPWPLPLPLPPPLWQHGQPLLLPPPRRPLPERPELRCHSAGRDYSSRYAGSIAPGRCTIQYRVVTNRDFGRLRSQSRVHPPVTHAETVLLWRTGYRPVPTI